MQVVDFTNLPRRNKLYAGANGSKISVIYEGQQYMLKFPPLPSKNKEMSYSNSCFSEYLGCQIYESIGIPVQKTMLGTYTVKGKTKIVVSNRGLFRRKNQRTASRAECALRRLYPQIRTDQFPRQCHCVRPGQRLFSAVLAGDPGRGEKSKAQSRPV